MKPLHIALLVAAGAIGGAVIMKISQGPSAPVIARTQTPPATAPEPAPATVPPPPAPPAPQPVAPEPVAAEPDRPSPFIAPKPVRSHRAIEPKPAPKVSPPIVAAAQPPRTEPVPAPAPAAAPQPVPPAPTEPEYVTPPPPAPPEPHRVTLNTGTPIPVRLVDGLSAERNQPGDRFMATLDKELVVDGFVIAERGARVEGRVIAADRGGRVRGVSSLQVEITKLHLSDGQTIAVQTDAFTREADSTHTQDAEKVGGGAAIGAIIGAIAGGGKGAAIGAGVGGAAGAGDVLATRGKPATLPSETRLTFHTRAPLTITERQPG
ncbi:MAG: hypothetical protein JWP63_5537 [Candidatus Solibacter sp.]|nr:hypothetical protein [Candidatus Solibacter sp.]